jgi:hypothetical protein
MPRIAEEMKAWSAALETEVADWPLVSRKPMFGLMALYYGAHIFAILPRTRALGLASSLAFKWKKAKPPALAQSNASPAFSNHHEGAPLVCF